MIHTNKPSIFLIPILAISLAMSAQSDARLIDLNAPHEDNTTVAKPPLPTMVLVQSCPPNQVMHGLSGGQPVCVPANCPPGQVLTGINNGQAVCVTGPNQSYSCAGNQVLQGIDNGQAVCVDPPASAQGTVGVVGAIKYVAGQGCGECPYGQAPHVDGSPDYCLFKNQNGDLLRAAASAGACGNGGFFNFWTY